MINREYLFTRPKICKYIGEPIERLKSLVIYRGLNAWKDSQRGYWKAKVKDLNDWLDSERDKNIKKIEEIRIKAIEAANNELNNGATTEKVEGESANVCEGSLGHYSK